MALNLKCLYSCFDLLFHCKSCGPFNVASFIIFIMLGHPLLCVTRSPVHWSKESRKRVNELQMLEINIGEFYVYGSVYHNIFYEITNRCSYMQSILFHYVHSTCFGCFTHPSSGVQFELYLQPLVPTIVLSQLLTSGCRYS